MTVSLSAFRTRALLLDIEGTTTPVGFVYDVLFPYARTHVVPYLEREMTSHACRAAVAQLREEAGVGTAQEFNLAAIRDFVFSLMDRDVKSPGLKALQGLIWQDGYRSGELRGEVYPDVLPALKRWKADGRGIYIYSSGSVLAQQLLFGSTAEGHLTAYLNGYFDTTVGPKTSPGSYGNIARSIEIAPAEIVFVSDVARELDASRATGMRTALCIRGAGDRPAAFEAHPIIRSFDEIVD